MAPTWKLKRPGPTAPDQHAVDEFARGQLDLPYSGIITPSIDGSAADPLPFEFSLRNAQGVAVIIDVTAISGAGATITVNLDAFDEPRDDTGAGTGVFGGSGSIAITATGTYCILLNPWLAAGTTGPIGGLTSVVAVQRGLHRNYRIRPVKSGTTTTLQYSIGLHVT